jgi:ATP-grasp domain
MGNWLHMQNETSVSGSLQISTPKILLMDTDRRAYAARLVIEFSKAGCTVSAVTTHRHPIEKTRAVRQVFRYSPLRPLDSLMAAIDATSPDIVIPCCDRSLQHLHELHAQCRSQDNGGGNVAALIERSLGPSSSYPIVSSRDELLGVAGEEGVRVPNTRPIQSSDDLKSWHAEQSLPWVLKSDGSWGGRGVRIARSLEQAEHYFREISRPFGLGRAIKRLCVNRDPFWLLPCWNGVRPTVVAQSFIQGHAANCGVVCWEGRVLGGIGVEVVSSEGSTGPATVVRVVDNPDMMRCAERIAWRLRLSGFFGLDFMIEEASGTTYLIEMNPRATPVCHLHLGKGRDMVGAFYAQLSGKPYADPPPVTQNDLIAYFPYDWNRDRELLGMSFQDTPQGEAALVKELTWPWPDRSFLFRATNYLHNLKVSARPIRDGQHNSKDLSQNEPAKTH